MTVKELLKKIQIKANHNRLYIPMGDWANIITWSTEALAALEAQPSPGELSSDLVLLLKKYHLDDTSVELIQRTRTELDRQATELKMKDELLFAYESVNAPINPLLVENKLLKEVLLQHRWDLHQRSNRPCPTCRQSAEALGIKVPDGCAKEDWDKQALKGK